MKNLVGFHDFDGILIMITRGGGHDLKDGFSYPVFLWDSGAISQFFAGIEIAAAGVFHMDIGREGVEDAAHEVGLAAEFGHFALLFADIGLRAPDTNEFVVFDNADYVV